MKKLLTPRQSVRYQPTPEEAWKEFIPYNALLDNLIMEELAKFGKDGAMCQDIEERINRPHQAVSANMSRLSQRGLIEPSGNYGKTHSGRRATKWRIRNKMSDTPMTLRARESRK